MRTASAGRRPPALHWHAVVPAAGAEKVAAELERLDYTVELHVFPTYGHDCHA